MIRCRARLARERPAHLRRLRVPLADGRRTTVHVAGYDARARPSVRVALVRGQRLAPWCAAQGVGEALVGGFFTRPDGDAARRGPHARRRPPPRRPSTRPGTAQRACVHVDRRRRRASPAATSSPAAPRGDLLQAGPLLVRDGAVVYDRARDPEGFSAGAAPVRLRHHRGAPPARRARARRRRAARRRLRRALAPRRRADARGARRRCSSASAPRQRAEPRRRRLDDARRRRAAAQPPARGPRTCPSRAAAPSRPRWCSPTREHVDGAGVGRAAVG